MPSVRDNTKFQCKTEGCGRIYDFPTLLDVRPCGGCGNVDYNQIRVTAVCDFCSGLNPEWTYPCRDFILNSPVPGLPADRKVGAWAACDACHELLEAGDRQAMIERALTEEPESREIVNADPGAKAMVVMFLTHAWDEFDRHRSGDPYRQSEGDPDAA